MRKLLNASMLHFRWFLFLVIVFELLLVVPSNQTGITSVGVFPSFIKAGVGQDFSISVNVTGVSDLGAWEFKLNWTTAVLSVVSVSEGSFLRSGGATFFAFGVNSTEGHMIVDCALLENVPGVSGNGVLATVIFDVKNAGQSPLDLYHALLLNSLEQAIPTQISSGQFNSFTHDIAVTSVSVSPITVLPGIIVYIDATVQDVGDFSEAFNVTVYENSQIIGIQTVMLSSGSSKTITFKWNTTGHTKGDYAISALASTVPGETNTNNNKKEAPQIVTILYNGHDIAIKSISSVKSVVGQGFSTNIMLAIKNYGVFTESFNVTTYANTTIIQRQAITLLSGSNIQLVLSWNTASYPKGNYIIKATADPVPGETNATDNTLSNGIVKVTISGDVNGDFIVNISDAAMIGVYWQQAVPPAPPNVDINGDSIINISDAALVGSHWQQ